MNPNDTFVNDDILVKYLLGEADTNEQLSVEKWISAAPENQKYLNDFKLILEKSQLSANTDEKDYDALARLNARMERTEIRPKQTPLFYWVRVAAAVLVVSMVGWFTYSFFNPYNRPVIVETTTATLKQPLSDGSLVILNKHSKISYLQRFSGKTRTISLQGEAFFNVEPDQSKPFIIKVNEVTVSVLGTSFNVKSRNGQTSVVVESGTVKVSKLNDSIELTKGEKVNINKGDLSLKKQVNKGLLYSYYYRNELVCDHTPLRELVAILNEKFNVNIIITKPALEELTINTTFKDESLQEILQILAKTFNFNIEQRANQILIK